jgi:hypothetical protein
MHVIVRSADSVNMDLVVFANARNVRPQLGLEFS